jgi:hypothetical protein
MTSESVAGITSQNSVFCQPSIEMEKAWGQMDKNLRPIHFSGNLLRSPPFPQEFSLFPLINIPTFMLILHCP